MNFSFAVIMFALILIDFCKGEIVLKANYGASHYLLSYKKTVWYLLTLLRFGYWSGSIKIVII